MQVEVLLEITATSLETSGRLQSKHSILVALEALKCAPPPGTDVACFLDTTVEFYVSQGLLTSPSHPDVGLQCKKGLLCAAQALQRCDAPFLV